MRAFLCKPFLFLQHLLADSGRKNEFCFVVVLFQPSKRSYASKVHKLDLYLAFFTASKTSKTADCAREMSLEREKAQWVSFFSIKISLEMKDDFSEAETFCLCSCETA